MGFQPPTNLNWWVDPGFLVAINPRRHPKDFSPARHPKAHTQVPGGHSSAGPGKPFGAGDFEKSNPGKINMERKNGGLVSLVQMIFLFNWVILGVHVKFQGCTPLKTNSFPGWKILIFKVGNTSTHSWWKISSQSADMLDYDPKPPACENSSENHRRMTWNFFRLGKKNTKTFICHWPTGGVGG